ncbi:MAG: excinuclease ABC subunit UvrB, partial [Nitrospinota bacterium]
AVEYFVSYYDYYQPEAYVPSTDTYIAKDASINEQLDKLRHATTRSVLTRRDVIVVASVSAIYGLGSPADYHGMHIHLRRGQRMDRDEFLTQLVQIQYRRNDEDFRRSTFRVRGDVVEVIPVHEEEEAIRVEFFGDEVDALREVDPLRGWVTRELEEVDIYPSSHYIAPEERFRAALVAIEEELGERAAELEGQGKPLEAQRLKQRTLYDLEMLREVGFCPGIENYSRHLDGRVEGEPPATLMQYFPRDHLVIVDEGHVTIPQLRGMYNGDRSRKLTLVEHGFRLPSALDNRPLAFEEFEGCVRRAIYVSATPGPYELERSGGVVVEQLVRPTGLTDPPVEVRPVRGQVDDLLQEVHERARGGERVLVTTLTKRFAEDLTEHYQDLGVRVRYMHSDIETLERVKIIRELRLGEFDVLIGINLLREGLDLPEVSLVAILDADKEGYLRSGTALIQTAGRAARNVNGTVIMYGDQLTRSMENAIRETERRRNRQVAYNREHGITPRSIQKNITDLLETVWERDYLEVSEVAEEPAVYGKDVEELRAEMRGAAERLEFERAAELRDRIRELECRGLGVKA